jgi:hypothetical protein
MFTRKGSLIIVYLRYLVVQMIKHPNPKEVRQKFD